MKKIYIITTICIATLLAACNNDQSPMIANDGNEVEVDMNIITPVMGRTRAYVPGEDKINNLYVLVFDASNAALEKDAEFLYYRHAWLNGTTNYRTILKTGTGLNIYLAANAESLITGAGLTEGMTYGEAREKLILTNPKGVLKDNIPMWGFVLDKTIQETPTYVNLGDMELLRSVASADLTITAPTTEFNFTNALLVWATTKGFLGYEANNIGTDDKIIAPKVPDNTDYDFGNDFTGAGFEWSHAPDANNEVLNKFYMFENDFDATVTPVPANRDYTKLIIEGNYDGSAGKTYYPLAFRNAAGDKIQAARNRKFELTITKFNGPGYPTPEEALNAEDVDMTFDVIVWDADGAQNSIIVDGTKYVSFPAGKTLLLADRANSGATLYFSTNALEWDNGDPLNPKPTNLSWSFDGFSSLVDAKDNNPFSYDPGATPPSLNDRFSVKIVKDDDEDCYLEVTVDKAYGVSGNHEATLSMQIGRIRFEVKLKQVQNAWIGGGGQDVDL